MKNVFLTTAVFTLSLALTGAEVRLLADRSDPGPVTGIAVQEGRIFASGGLGEPLQELDGTGAVRRAWGRKFIADKHGLRSSGGYLYATDIGNHQVFKMTPDGEVVMTLGEKGVPGCDETHFNKPTDVAVAPDGDIYVTDGYGNRRVACFGPDGRFKFAWGKEGSGPGEFKNPHNIVIGSDNRVYVADRDNRRLQIFDRKGVLLEIRPDAGQLFGLDTDGERLFLTMARPEWHGLVVTALDGTVLASVGGKGKKVGEFDVPHSVAFDRGRNCLWIGEVNNRRLQKVQLPETSK